ncbi:centromere protein X isoform X1 [Suricata suricatta]|uniref:centromere protein X isoform X1 n=2 Tax=Suricata suricatta TaxID=37032 RepID=UPI001155961D|nr:centromere protein X isoform X1 [Suricata suricatta]
MEGTSGDFRKELVGKLLQLHFKDDKTKVSGDALRLMAELLKIFVVEAAIRSVRQAQAEDLALVDVDQLEKVLPQLVGGLWWGLGPALPGAGAKLSPVPGSGRMPTGAGGLCASPREQSHAWSWCPRSRLLRNLSAI